VALTAVIVGVLVLAAAAFVLSYSGIHAIAQQAGISATLARGYPVIFDALLVITCAAVLSLRGAGPVSRFYAWLSLLVLLGATAGADALHSTGTVVPHRTAALAAAVIPWILLLIGFGLLLAMLRHFRLHRAAPAAAAGVPPVTQEDHRAAGWPALPPGAPSPAAAGPPVSVPQQAPSGPAESIAAPGPDLFGLDSDEDPSPGTGDPADAAVPEEIFAAPSIEDDASDQGPASQPAGPAAPQPAFHRMWSSPTPPGDEDEG
jgi:hypothetical protein